MRFDSVIAAQMLWLFAATTQLTFAETENPTLREHQVQLPNDVEQKASYCMAVIKLQYSTTAQFTSSFESSAKSATDPRIRKLLEKAAVSNKEETGRLGDNINRLQSFLLPRTPYLAPTAMLAAYSRGEADFRRQQESSKVKQCMDRCKSSIETDQDPGGSCIQECMEKDELNRRIFQCRDLSFLPY